MSALSYKNDDKQDERLNPAETAHDIHAREQNAGSSFDDIVNNYGKTADPKQENANIDKINRAENGWDVNLSEGPKKKQRIRGAMRFLKRKSAMGVIIAMLFGGGGGLAVIVSPGFAIVQFKEALLGDLNDQLGATSLRSDKLLRAKLKNLQGNFSICSSTVSIRCKFSTMSRRQVKKFEKAGFKIEGEKAGVFKTRTKPVSITFPPPEGKKVGVIVTDPNQLRNHVLESPEARAALRRAYNPRFASLSDAIAAKVFAKFKTSKSKKVTGESDEERDKNMNEQVSGEKANIDTNGRMKDENGKEYVLDEEGKRIYESDDADKFKEISEENKKKLGNIADGAASPAKATGSVLKSGLKGVSVLGATDTACTVYNVARAVAAAGKTARALQLAQLFIVLANEADEIKQGTATPEDTQYIGKKLTAVDTNKTVQDEKSEKEVANPYYQKNALDSPGYQTAAYNDAPTLTARDSQYTVGGGLVGTLATVMATIDKVIPGGRKNIRKTCHVVQSWWARGIGLIAGVATAIGSFGTGTAAMIAASVAIGFALPFLEAQLADILAGKVVSAATKGVDFGNAAFAGAGAFLGTMAMAHGLMPATLESMKSYLSATQQVKDEYIAMEKYEARKTPFDVMNQYSFLGSAVRMINPTLVKSTASISGALTNIPSLLTVGFSGVVPHASAIREFNEDRFKKCNDDGYDELGIDADVFCNVRYQMSPRQLNMEPDEAATWMLKNDHIEEDGSPKSDEYKKWIEFCTERKDGWGETSSDDNVSDWDVGKECMKKKARNVYFPVFYLDKATNESMDSPAADGGSISDTAFTTSPLSDTNNLSLTGMYP